MEIFGISTALLGSQLLVGLINGSFYAILSLGLAIIFGLLNIINFCHGAQYMMGAFVAWIALTRFGINYWVALIAAPLIVGVVGVLIERLMLRRLYKLDHLYGLLLTFGLALIFEGIFRDQFGISVGLSGDTAIVGAFTDDVGANTDQCSASCSCPFIAAGSSLPR